MKIIIAGGGEVGFHLAKLLSFESLDITLIDTEKERLNYAESHLDIKAIKGDAGNTINIMDNENGLDLNGIEKTINLLIFSTLYTAYGHVNKHEIMNTQIQL